MAEIAVKQRKAMPRGTPFPAGQSGNPNGRPRNEACVTPILRELLQSNPAALARLWQKRKSGTTGAMQIALALFAKAQKGDMAAITQVLNRIDGMPTQPMEHTGRDGGPMQFQAVTDLTDEQLAVIAAQAIVRTPAKAETPE